MRRWQLAVVMFELVTRPFRLALIKLVKRTGRSSAAYTRVAIHATALVMVWETVDNVSRNDIAGALIVAVILVMTVPWALRRVERMERALDEGRDYLTDGDIRTLVIWALLYSWSGIILLPSLFIFGDLFSVRSAGIVAITAGLTTPLKGRPKTKRAAIPVPA